MEEVPVPELNPNARRTPRRPKRERRFIRQTVLCSLLLAAFIALLTFLYIQLRPTLVGERIDRAIAGGDFPQALALLETLDDEQAAEEYGNHYAYAIAQQSFAAGDYPDAEARFAALGSYADAPDMVNRCVYQRAEAQLNEGSFEDAAKTFSLLGAYEDAALRLNECRYHLADALEKNGDLSSAASAFLSLGDYQDARTRAGTLAMQLTGESEPEAAINILTSLSPEQQNALLLLNTLREKLRLHIVAAGFYHSVALRKDGTVLAAGRNDEGQCGVSGWSHVTAIDAGAYHTVALTQEGTALAAGRNDEGQCDVSAWTDLIAIAAGDYTTYGLKSDGSVVFTGYQDVGDSIASWSGITDIAAGSYMLLGLADGTASATHPSAQSALMAGLVSADASTGYAVGLKEDGTLVCTSDAVDLSTFPSSVAISCASTYVASIGIDGMVYTHFFRECDAFDCVAHALPVALDAGNLHLLLVTEDGRVLSFGSNETGACETTGWRLWD